MTKMKKVTAVVLSAILLVTATVAATVAYLTDSTDEVVNTFTLGDVVVTLDETDLETGERKNEGNAYQVIPGNSYLKDPKVSVVGTNVDCWLFVKFVEGDAQTYFNYTSTLTTANGWTQGTGTIPANVWYRDVEDNAAVKEWYLLEGDETYTNGVITVDAEAVTEATMANAVAETLEWTAYVAQKDNLTAAEAWAALNP